MKKFAAWIAVLCLFSTLISCADGPATTVSVPAAALFTPTVPPNGALEDFQNKELAGEDDTYSIYLVNRTGGTDAAPTGELLVLNKSTDQVMEMNGSFTVIIDGGTIVYDDGKGGYILLSIGTYTSRKAVVLSLKDQNQAVNDFCMASGPNGDHLFWNNLIIINNCDTFPNRPWGQGEAPGITAIDLEAGTETVIARSDLTHQFQIERIEGNNLRYIETYVENEEDWQTADKQKTEERSFDLSSLSSSP